MTRTVPGGWTLETVIPAWVLGVDALAAGQEYPFTFGLWDDDARSTQAQTHMLWRGTSPILSARLGHAQPQQHNLQLPGRCNANAAPHGNRHGNFDHSTDADSDCHDTVNTDQHAYGDGHTDCFADGDGDTHPDADRAANRHSRRDYLG